MKHLNSSVAILFIIKWEQNKSGQTLLIQDKKKFKPLNHPSSRLKEIDWKNRNIR